MRSRFMAVFVSVQKEEEKKEKNEETKPILKLHISGMLEAILLKFGMWSTEVGRRVHSKNRRFIKAA